MLRWIGLGGVALGAVAVGLVLGPTAIGPGDVLAALLGRGDDTTVTIVRDLRATRAVLAFLVGGGLAVTGAALQALVRNPLADPYLLGLSGGAGLGAVAAIAFGLSGMWGVPLAALAGSLLAVGLVYRLAVVSGSVLDPRVLLLGGVVVGAFAASLMGAIMAVAPAPEIRNALLWLLGSDSIGGRQVEQHKVGLARDDRLDVGAQPVADARHIDGRFGILSPPRPPHHTVARPKGKQQFRDGRGQRHDALRHSLERHDVSGIITQRAGRGGTASARQHHDDHKDETGSTQNAHSFPHGKA